MTGAVVQACLALLSLTAVACTQSASPERRRMAPAFGLAPCGVLRNLRSQQKSA